MAKNWFGLNPANPVTANGSDIGSSIMGRTGGLAGIETEKAPRQAFFGSITPERYDMAMQMLQSAMGAASNGSASPAVAFLTPLAAGLVGRKAADRVSAARDGARKDASQTILEMMNPAASSNPYGDTARPMSENGVSAGADDIRAGLVKRGLPEHVADAFVMNFRDESGLRTDINEIAPLVPGSRGGFGLAQWTGPRRKQLEQFAAQRGTSVSDLDTQLDFLVYELQGPEKQAGEKILASQNSQEAAVAVLDGFLRPAPEHANRRRSKYLGGAVSAPTFVQAEQGNTPAAAPALAQGAGPQQLERLMAIMDNPWASEGQKAVAQQFLLRMTQPGDPMDAIELERAQLELDQLRNPTPDPLDGAPDRYMWAEPGNPSAGVVPIPGLGPQPGFRMATPEEAAQYGAIGGQIGPDNRFYPINPPSNGITQTITRPDGTTETFQVGGSGGGSGRGMTEAQSKDTVYATRAEGALEAFEPVANALTSYVQNGMEIVPFGLARGFQTEDFQRARQSGRELLAVILRKDTGAAVTLPEEKMYGEVFLPQPGDLPGVLEQKRVARIRAVEALKAGMGPEQILRMGQALFDTEMRLDDLSQPGLGSAQGAAPPQPGQALPDGLTEDDLRYLGMD